MPKILVIVPFALDEAGVARRKAQLKAVRLDPQSEFHFQYSQAEYLEGLEIWATGRFVKEMLGDEGWLEFQARVRSTFAERFADPLNDFRDVILAVGSKH